MKRSHLTKYGSEGLFDCPTCCVCPALPVSSARLCLGDAFHGCVQRTGGVVEPPASAAYCPSPHTCSAHVPLPTGRFLLFAASLCPVPLFGGFLREKSWASVCHVLICVAYTMSELEHRLFTHAHEKIFNKEYHCSEWTCVRESTGPPFNFS